MNEVNGEKNEVMQLKERIIYRARTFLEQDIGSRDIPDDKKEALYQVAYNIINDPGFVDGREQEWREKVAEAKNPVDQEKELARGLVFLVKEEMRKHPDLMI